MQTSCVWDRKDSAWTDFRNVDSDHHCYCLPTAMYPLPDLHGHEEHRTWVLCSTRSHCQAQLSFACFAIWDPHFLSAQLYIFQRWLNPRLWQGHHRPRKAPQRVAPRSAQGALDQQAAGPGDGKSCEDCCMHCIFMGVLTPNHVNFFSVAVHDSVVQAVFLLHAILQRNLHVRCSRRFSWFSWYCLTTSSAYTAKSLTLFEQGPPWPRFWRHACNKHINYKCTYITSVYIYIYIKTFTLCTSLGSQTATRQFSNASAWRFSVWDHDKTALLCLLQHQTECAWEFPKHAFTVCVCCRCKYDHVAKSVYSTTKKKHKYT